MEQFETVSGLSFKTFNFIFSALSTISPLPVAAVVKVGFVPSPAGRRLG
jgi:hypothetical protein